jgi:hypothetical protein
MQKKSNIGYDETKKMLNTLRSLNHARTSLRTLKEELEPQTDETQPSTEKVMDDILVVNDVEVKLLSSDSEDMEIKDEQKNAISELVDNFRQQVSQIVDLDPGFTVAENQIRLDGTLTNEDINFVMIAGEEDGLYLNSDMLKIEEDTVLSIQKLVKFQETFKTTMEPLITQRSNN